jgi:hypothetical protein
VGALNEAVDQMSEIAQHHPKEIAQLVSALDEFVSDSPLTAKNVVLLPTMGRDDAGKSYMLWSGRLLALLVVNPDKPDQLVLAKVFWNDEASEEKPAETTTPSEMAPAALG